jgi:predicted MFS family arabinose efflux permease
MVTLGHYLRSLVCPLIYNLISSQALCTTAPTFPVLLAYNIVASAGAGICETVAVMVVDEYLPIMKLD